MHRLTAFGIVTLAAVVFVLVAYEKLMSGFSTVQLMNSESEISRVHLKAAETSGKLSETTGALSVDNRIPIITESRTTLRNATGASSFSSSFSSSSDASITDGKGSFFDDGEVEQGNDGRTHIKNNLPVTPAIQETKNSIEINHPRDDVHMYSSKSRTEAVNDNKPIHIIVLARMRTGSSLIGEIFNQNPSLFYIFEPLHAVDTFIRKHRAAETHRKDISISTLRLLNKCEFSQEFLASVSKWGLGKAKSSGLLPICRVTDGCRTARHTQVEDRCKSLGSRVGMKTIRADLSMVQPLIEEDNMNVKIIHLVRDPRGTASSRKSYYGDRKINPSLERAVQAGRISLPLSLKSLGLLDPRPAFRVNTIVKYCQWIDDIIPVVISRPKWVTDRYRLIRYEDLARDPLRMSRAIYDFVGLTMPKNVEQWVVNNTSQDDTNSSKKFSTHKNSSETMQSWRHSLSYNEVMDVQRLCGHAMQLTGYKKIVSPNDLEDLHFDVTVPLKIGKDLALT